MIFNSFLIFMCYRYHSLCYNILVHGNVVVALICMHGSVLSVHVLYHDSILILCSCDNHYNVSFEYSEVTNHSMCCIIFFCY